MNQDDEQNVSQAPPAKPFGALRQHVKTYKDQIERLKQGASSGISGLLGSAAELLPETALKKYNLFKGPSARGDSFLKDGAQAADLNSAKESVSKALEDNEGEFAQASTPEQQVIGVFYENGRRKFLLSDFTVIDVPQEPDSRELDHAAGQQQVPSPSSRRNDDLPEQEDPLAAALLEEELTEGNSQFDGQKAVEAAALENATDNLNSMRQFDEAVAPEQVLETPAADNPKPEEKQPEQRIAPTDLNQSERVSPLAAMARAVGSELAASRSDLRVTDENGNWMWDIVFVGKEVGQVEMADGCKIYKTTEPSKYVVITPVEAADIPRVEIVASVNVDKKTGNFSYYNLSGEHWVACLNNGWRIEHYRKAPCDEKYVLTEPRKPGRTTRNKIEVSKLQIDPDSGDVSFEPWDGAGTTTLRSKKLQ
jgi:hypothetical protein